MLQVAKWPNGRVMTYVYVYDAIAQLETNVKRAKSQLVHLISLVRLSKRLNLEEEVCKAVGTSTTSAWTTVKEADLACTKDIGRAAGWYFASAELVYDMCEEVFHSEVANSEEYKHLYARVVELADTPDSSPGAARREDATSSSGTTQLRWYGSDLSAQSDKIGYYVDKSGGVLRTETIVSCWENGEARVTEKVTGVGTKTWRKV